VGDFGDHLCPLVLRNHFLIKALQGRKQHKKKRLEIAVKKKNKVPESKKRLGGLGVYLLCLSQHQSQKEGVRFLVHIKRWRVEEVLVEEVEQASRSLKVVVRQFQSI